MSRRLVDAIRQLRVHCAPLQQYGGMAMPGRDRVTEYLVDEPPHDLQGCFIVGTDRVPHGLPLPPKREQSLVHPETCHVLAGWGHASYVDPKTVYALCAANKLTGGTLVLSRRIHTGFHFVPPFRAVALVRSLHTPLYHGSSRREGRQPLRRSCLPAPPVQPGLLWDTRWPTGPSCSCLPWR